MRSLLIGWTLPPSVGLQSAREVLAGAASVLEGLEELPQEASALGQNEDIKM